MLGACKLSKSTDDGQKTSELDYPKEWKVFLPIDKNYQPTEAELSRIPETLCGRTPLLRRMDNKLDLAPDFGGVVAENCAWLYAELNSDKECEYNVGVGADWWFAYYLNGKEVQSTFPVGNTSHPPTMFDHCFKLNLKKGKNIIAIKFASGDSTSVIASGGEKELSKNRNNVAQSEEGKYYSSIGLPLNVESVVPKNLNDKIEKGLAPEGYVVDSYWLKLLKPKTSTLIDQNNQGPEKGKAIIEKAELNETSVTLHIQGTPAFSADEKLFAMIKDKDGHEIYGKFGSLADYHAIINEDGSCDVTIPDFSAFKYGEKSAAFLYTGICNRDVTGKYNQEITIGGDVYPGEQAILKIEKTPAGPTPMLNGKPFFYNCFTIHPYVPERNIPTGMEGPNSPFNVIAFRVGGNAATGEWWCGPDKYDFTRLDWCINSVIKEFPDSKIGLYVWCHPGNWYTNTYPERIAKNQNGNICTGYYVSMVSFSNPEMQKDTYKAISELVKHCEKYFGSKIVLYNLMGGISCEWQGWNSHSKTEYTDYSETSLNEFKKYAAAKGVSVDHIPTPKEHSNHTNGTFRDLKADSLVLLYDRFYSESIANFIDNIAATVKQNCNYNKLVGCYYGYHQEYSNLPNTANRGGHNAFNTLLNSENVDFFLSPQSYSLRELGNPNGDMKPYGAARLNGKFSIMEDDTRTHKLDECGYGQLLNQDHTLKALTRNAGMYLCHRNPINQLAEHGGDEMDTPELRDFYAKTLEAGQYIMEQSNDIDPTEIAAVIDEKSITLLPTNLESSSFDVYDTYHYNYDGWLSLKQKRHVLKLIGELLGAQRFPLARVGAPVDVIMLEDVVKSAGKYKVVIFLNAFQYTTELQNAFDALRAKDTTIIVAYGAGFINNEGISTASMNKLLGMNMSVAKPGNLQVKFDNRTPCGAKYSVSPRFCVSDKNANVIAKYIEGNDTAVAMKNNVYFCGSPLLDENFIRDVARKKGVHIYTETGDNLYAGSHCLSIHALKKGVKDIALPEKHTVVDAYSGKTIAKNTQKFKISMEAMESRVFLLK